MDDELKANLQVSIFLRATAPTYIVTTNGNFTSMFINMYAFVMQTHTIYCIIYNKKNALILLMYYFNS